MKHLKQTLLLCGASMLLSGTAFGEAGISTRMGGAPADVTANVRFQINVPEIIILRVGDWSNTVNTVVWNYAFGAGITNPTNNGDATNTHWDKITASAPDAQNANSDNEGAADRATDGALRVAAFSNTGSVSLTAATVTDFAAISTGLNKPSLSEISATGTGSINHEPLNGFAGSGSVTLGHTGGIVRLTDTWQYTYTPTVNPAAGTYNAEVQYTLVNI